MNSAIRVFFTLCTGSWAEIHVCSRSSCQILSLTLGTEMASSQKEARRHKRINKNPHQYGFIFILFLVIVADITYHIQSITVVKY